MQNFSFAHFRVGRGVYRLCSIFLYVYGCLCCWLWLEDDCARACDCALTLTFLGFVKFVSALLASCVASDVPSVRDRFLRWFVVDILQLWTPRLFCCVIWIEILKSGNLGQFFPYRRVLLSCVESCRLVLFSVVYEYCVLRTYYFNYYWFCVLRSSFYPGETNVSSSVRHFEFVHFILKLW